MSRNLISLVTVVFLTTCGIPLGGCGTFSDAMYGPITIPVTENPVYYRGVRFDLMAMKEGGANIFMAADIPFSAVADTFLIFYCACDSIIDLARTRPESPPPPGAMPLYLNDEKMMEEVMKHVYLYMPFDEAKTIMEAHGFACRVFESSELSPIGGVTIPCLHCSRIKPQAKRGSVTDEVCVDFGIWVSPIDGWRVQNVSVKHITKPPAKVENKDTDAFYYSGVRPDVMAMKAPVAADIPFAILADAAFPPFEVYWQLLMPQQIEKQRLREGKQMSVPVFPSQETSSQ